MVVWPLKVVLGPGWVVGGMCNSMGVMKLGGCAGCCVV